MDLRRLRTFVTVAEQGSVSKAALRLHISQPALSRQIHDLQYEFKLKLFERVGRRLVLTTEGEQLLASCRGLLHSASAVSEQAQLLRGGDTGVLRVAASPVQFESVLSEFLPRYMARYPHVEVKLIEAVGTALFLLDRGEVHVAIGVIDAAAVEDSHLAIHPVAPLELLAACHKSYRLDRAGSIDVRQIASHPLLLPDSSFNSRKIFDAVCQQARVAPNILIESRSPHAVLSLAEAGLGIAIITTATRSDRYALRVVGVTDRRKPIQVPQAIVWDRRRTLPRYAQDFCDSLAARMRKPFSTANLATRFRRRTRKTT